MQIPISTATQNLASKNVVSFKSLSIPEGPIKLVFKNKTLIRTAQRVDQGVDGTLYLNREDRTFLDIALTDKITISTIKDVRPIKTLCVRIFDKSKIKEVVLDPLMVHLKILNTVVNVNSYFCFLDNELYSIKFESLIDDQEMEYGFVTKDTEIVVLNVKDAEPVFSLKTINFQDIGIGGLDKQFTTLVKSLFLTRIIPKSTYERLGIKHIKGCLLYGPPGCGKTRIARKLGSLMSIKEGNVQVVNGPELLNKFVGESEKAIRDCFEKANQNPKELYLLIFDEFDALARKRSGSSTNDNGDKVVAQLLTMLDGVREINNIIVFALTNRIDILDSAVLRPGRFSLHIKIDLPDAKGRREILQIHSKILADNKFIDAVNFDQLALLTDGYTGAELESLIQKTVHSVLGDKIDFNDIVKSAAKIEGLNITTENFVATMDQIEPMFKSAKSKLSNLTSNIKCLPSVDSEPLLESLKNSDYAKVYAIAGAPKSGKTSLLCDIGIKSGKDVEYITGSTLMKMNLSEKVEYLEKVFSEKDRLILLDNFELLIEFVSEMIFDRTILQTLKVLLNETTNPVIITTSYYARLFNITAMDAVTFTLYIE